jgi:hypothetical protein
MTRVTIRCLCRNPHAPIPVPVRCCRFPIIALRGARSTGDPAPMGVPPSPGHSGPGPAALAGEKDQRNETELPTPIGSDPVPPLARGGKRGRTRNRYR